MSYFYEILLVCAVISTIVICLTSYYISFALTNIDRSILYIAKAESIRNDVLINNQSIKILKHKDTIKHYLDEARRDWIIQRLSIISTDVLWGSDYYGLSIHGRIYYYWFVTSKDRC